MDKNFGRKRQNYAEPPPYFDYQQLVGSLCDTILLGSDSQLQYKSACLSLMQRCSRLFSSSRNNTNKMIRVRLFFDSLSPNLGSYASLPVKKCWMMINLGTCKIVKDFEELIRRRFFENEEVKLSLSIDDFTLPSDEVIEIIRENEIIRWVYMCNRVMIEYL